jgi:hypothetical protein
MALTKADVEAEFEAAREELVCGVVDVALGGETVKGIRANLTGEQLLSMRGAHPSFAGAVRVLQKDFSGPMPKAGDRIRITEGDADVDRIVLSASQDQSRATVRIDYGDKWHR